MTASSYLTLNDFRDIAARGFSYKLPQETIEVIRELCTDMNVGFTPSKLRDYSVQPTRYAGGCAPAEWQPSQ